MNDVPEVPEFHVWRSPDGMLRAVHKMSGDTIEADNERRLHELAMVVRLNVNAARVYAKLKDSNDSA